MHISSPRYSRVVRIEPRARRTVTHIHILQQIASAPLAEEIGVICRCAVRDGFSGSSKEVGKVVGDALQLIWRELHIVVDDDVVCRSSLASWLTRYSTVSVGAIFYAHGAFECRMCLQIEIPTVLHCDAPVDHGPVERVVTVDAICL